MGRKKGGKNNKNLSTNYKEIIKEDKKINNAFKINNEFSGETKITVEEDEILIPSDGTITEIRKGDIVGLSEENIRKVEKGLQEAREGKIERVDLKKLLAPLTKEQRERREKLKGVMRDINKNIEGAKVDYANTIESRERQSFGYLCLDKLTGGGIVRGNTTVIWGSKGCFVAGTKILMNNYTWKNIELIKKGDMILGFKQDSITKQRIMQVTEVLETFKRVSDDIVYIKSDKSEIITTSEHPFLTLTGWNNKRSSRWSNASQLREGKTILKYFPCREVNNDWKQGWLIGIILSDGSITKPKLRAKNNTVIHIYNKQDIIIQKCKEWLKDIFHLETVEIFKKPNLFQISINNSYFGHVIGNIKDKILCDYKQFNKDFLRGFIAGYCDGDGTHKVTKNTKHDFKFHSTDKIKLLMIKDILKEFDFTSSLELKKLEGESNIKGKIYKTKKVYCLNIYSPLKFYLEFMQLLKTEGNYCFSRQLDEQKILFKARRKIKTEVYNISTGTETYIANGFPVHNCGKTTIALKLIATAQKEGKIAAYLDVERSYDPVWAKRFGVDTETLVYLVCPTAEAVMDAVIKLCKEKVVDVIVLDSIQGLSPHGEQFSGKADKEKSVQDDTMALLARKMSQFFRMAISHISEAKCALLLIGQARMDLGSFIKIETLSGGHSLLHNSRLILRIRRGQGADAPTEKRPTGEKDKNGKEKLADVKIGFDAVIHVNKSQIQGCTEGDEIHVPFYFEDGIKED